MQQMVGKQCNGDEEQLIIAGRIHTTDPMSFVQSRYFGTSCKVCLFLASTPMNKMWGEKLLFKPSYIIWWYKQNFSKHEVSGSTISLNEEHVEPVTSLYDNFAGSYLWLDEY